eukprot:CAMPEP_0206175678 /NCGR_PEP_ID=MMETSP1474-20131121/55663_1 /ASSEMBLY_ACC=CAM_ASM_001110 /TAXON_ID=97495 /ORGANISM="Imantonia sp., Strain RCC918" /LENGTH=51 /DNA_ID=CAMNT_0053586089 /DNA_START=455 /DNA_END=606 /DNA_ORIENTATION=-
MPRSPGPQYAKAPPETAAAAQPTARAPGDRPRAVRRPRKGKYRPRPPRPRG